MQTARYLSFGFWLLLTQAAVGQTVVTWSSNSDQRWNRNANWAGSNQPNTSGEIAQFGTGSQFNPELNTNSNTVRGIRFSAAAGSYNVGDDNGARTLRIGNNTSGFIENLSANNQAIAIATLQFQSDATIRTTGGGELAIDSRLTGTNRNLTFNTASDITVGGNITTGGGTLTKQGVADLHLSGANTYTGATSIEAGAIDLGASDVFANANRVDITAGGSLRLNDYSDTIARLTGAGTVDFGLAGTGRLTLGSGSSNFAGTFAGSGELVIGAGATLTLGADFNNPNLNLTLAGGTLRLAGNSLAVGALNVSGDSLIDFAAGSSDLAVQSLSFGAPDITLTVQNWVDAADYFYSQTGYSQGTAPLDQVEFAGWSAADTRWQDYDRQITPLPEPAKYGAGLVGTILLLAWGRLLRAGCR